MDTEHGALWLLVAGGRYEWRGSRKCMLVFLAAGKSEKNGATRNLRMKVVNYDSGYCAGGSCQRKKRVQCQCLAANGIVGKYRKWY